MCPKTTSKARTEIIVAIIGTIGVLGTGYLAYLGIREKTQRESTAIPAPLGPEVKTLERNAGDKTQLTRTISIGLLDVNTLKGKSKRSKVDSKVWDPDSGIDYNKSLDDKEHIFKKIMFLAGKADDPQKYLRMSPEQWNTFLDGIESDSQREQIKQIPFARFAVSVNGKEDDQFQKNAFFEGEWFPIFDGRQTVTVEVVKIRNTKGASRAHESVEIRFR